MTVRLTEWEKTVSGWTWIEVTENKVINLILRELNNLIKVNGNNEVYVDLQLDDNLLWSDTLPVWVTTGRVIQYHGRPITGTLISSKTTSWDVVKLLYWDDGRIYVNNGGWVWNILAYEYVAWEWIAIDEEILWDCWPKRWPCDFWFHIPTVDEAQFLLTISQRSDTQLPGSWVKAPNNGYIKFQNPNIYASWTRWTCTASSNTGEDHHTNAYMLCYDDSGYMPAQPLAPTDKSYWCWIRAFKDNPVIPDETWTILWQNLRWAFYWNETLGLITAHNTDTNQYVTLQDKNVGATNVGDNWLYFQWGNNQWFTSASAATSHTPVDASWYEPSTYAADPIYTSHDWSSEENDNLWGWKTPCRQYPRQTIRNTWVLSVNNQTWHVRVWESLFKTEEEYEALPSSKATDDNLYIIVDTHLHPLPRPEVWEKWSAWGLNYLNQHPLDYAAWYEWTGDVTKRFLWGPADDDSKYVYVYEWEYIDEDELWHRVICCETNCTEQELEQHYDDSDLRELILSETRVEDNEK
jgi:hypothetical protein